MNAIDHEDSDRLCWLDYQLSIIGSLGTETQEALSDHLVRIRQERRAILEKQPVGEREKVRA